MALTSINLPEKSKKFLELYYGSKKVRDYNEEDLKKLYKFILALCKLVGVTEAPDTDVVLLLIDHIQEHHSNFSKEEIQKAFSLATAGKLNFEFKHYNRITPQIISIVLSKYDEFRSKEVLAFEHKLMDDEEERIREENKPTPKQELIIKINSCISTLKSYKEELHKPKSERLRATDWGNLNYLFLEDIGVINYSSKEKNEIKLDAKKAITIENKQKRSYKPISRVNKIGFDKNTEVVKESRQIALEKFFDYVVENSLSLELLIADKLNGKKGSIYYEVSQELKNATKGS